MKKFQPLRSYVRDLGESAEVAVGCNDPLMPGCDLIGQESRSTHRLESYSNVAELRFPLPAEQSINLVFDKAIALADV